MNWNPFKRKETVRDSIDLVSRVEKLERTSITQAMDEIKSIRLMLMDMNKAHRALEAQFKELGNPSDDNKWRKILDAERDEHKRTYAREYYYRKKVNQPTMKQLAAKKKPKVTSNDSNVQAMDFSPVTARDGGKGNDKGTAGEAGS